MTNATAAATPTNGHAKNGHTLDGRGAAAPLSAVSDGAGKTAIEKAAPPAAAAEGRAQGGRFGSGNKFGRGNPFTRKFGAMRAAFLDAVTTDDVKDLAQELLAKALKGDLAAAALFLAYAVGKPGEAIDPDDADLDEFSRVLRRPTGRDVLDAAMRNDPLLAAQQALQARPYSAGELAQAAVAEMKAASGAPAFLYDFISQVAGRLGPAGPGAAPPAPALPAPAPTPTQANRAAGRPTPGKTPATPATAAARGDGNSADAIRRGLAVAEQLLAAGGGAPTLAELLSDDAQPPAAAKADKAPASSNADLDRVRALAATLGQAALAAGKGKKG